MVIIRYWAAARDAAGADQEAYAARTVADAIAQAHDHHTHQPHFARVIGMSSLLVDGRRIDLADRDLATPLSHGSTIEVLPPFAGG